MPLVGDEGASLDAYKASLVNQKLTTKTTNTAKTGAVGGGYDQGAGNMKASEAAALAKIGPMMDRYDPFLMAILGIE